MSGTAVFSVEVELGWGYHDLQRSNKYAALSKNRDAETAALERLLALCDRFEIPISFNVVGHLLLDSCSGVHDGAYPADWFDADPGTDVASDPLFYAPDLVEMIEAAEVDHEICTHTFSHALGNEFSSVQLDTDLKEAQRLQRRRFGEPAESIVPPRHQQMDPEVLKQNGIRVIRKTRGQMPDTRPELLRWYFSRNHPITNPVTENGIVTTYTSVVQSMTAPYVAQGQRTVHPVLRSIPLRVRRYIHRQYVEDALDRTVANGKQAHFWTHLKDMANERQFGIVKQLLSLVWNKHNETQLKIVKISDISEG